MPFEHKDATSIFKIPALAPGSHVYFADVLGSRTPSVPNPIVGSWFRIEKGEPASPPEYDYDEVGVVVEGTMTLRDETGVTATLGKGDTFVIHRGSTIAFSSSTYGVAFKCASRVMAKL